MTPDDRIRLQHIADALDSVARFTEGRTRAELEGDQMLSFALLHAIQIVGEAASKISLEARAQAGQVPWAALIGMRHRLVHGYFDINRDILWTTATEAAPYLRQEIERLLAPDRPLE